MFIKYTRTEGIYSYYEICEKLKTPGWNLKFNFEQMVSYCYSSAEWVGFDNRQSLKFKVLEKTMIMIIKYSFMCFYLKNDLNLIKKYK
jgi:hypothetical protein